MPGPVFPRRHCSGTLLAGCGGWGVGGWEEVGQAGCRPGKGSARALLSTGSPPAGLCLRLSSDRPCPLAANRAPAWGLGRPSTANWRPLVSASLSPVAPLGNKAHHTQLP